MIIFRRTEHKSSRSPKLWLSVVSLEARQKVESHINSLLETLREEKGNHMTMHKDADWSETNM